MVHKAVSDRELQARCDARAVVEEIASSDFLLDFHSFTKMLTLCIRYF